MPAVGGWRVSGDPVSPGEMEGAGDPSETGLGFGWDCLAASSVSSCVDRGREDQARPADGGQRRDRATSRRAASSPWRTCGSCSVNTGTCGWQKLSARWSQAGQALPPRDSILTRP